LWPLRGGGIGSTSTTTEQGDAHSSLPAALGRATHEIEIITVVASLIAIWATALVLLFLL
jgi:hypothetical protein